MDISKELRDGIQESIFVGLETWKEMNAHKQEGEEITDCDEFLTLSVSDFLQGWQLEPKADVIDGKTPVQYIGHRHEYSDALYETGLWKSKQVKMVSDVVAAKMLQHTDVYVVAGDAACDGAESVDAPHKKEPPDADHLQNARDAIIAMTRKQAVIEFVAQNFIGMAIPAEYTKLDEMKAFAIQQVDIYGLP